MDRNIQEIWDTAKRISCVWSTQLTKQVIFKPFKVSMLDVVSTTFQGDDIKCWMDIRKGVYPETTELDDTVNIGDEISLFIYLQDSENKADVGIRDCWAYGGEDEDKKDRLQVQLTSEEGCVLRPKLMAEWKKASDVINGEETLVAYATISAFKFPDRANVHMTCNVEICSEKCKQCNSKEDLSLPELSLQIKNVDISTTATLNYLEPRRKQFEKPSVHLNEHELTMPRRNHPVDLAMRDYEKAGVNLGEIAPLSHFHPLIKPVPNPSGINQLEIEPGFIQPNIDILLLEPPVQAIMLFEDPQVPVNDGKTLPQFISKDLPFPIQNQCHPASTDPNCFVQLVHANRLPLTTDITGQIKVKSDLCKNGLHHPDCDFQECFTGSLDPKCIQNKLTVPSGETFVSTIVPGESLKEPHCLPGSRNPTCLEHLVNQKSILPEPNYYLRNPEGLEYDTKPKEEAEEEEIYYKPFCHKGSNDPRCEFFPFLDFESDKEKSVESYTTPLVPSYTTPLVPSYTTPLVPSYTTPLVPLVPSYTTSLVPYPCLPGSLDPNCHLCDSRDPNCKSPLNNEDIQLPLCHPNSQNKNCYSSANPPEIKQQNFILFNCLPGSRDPRCALPLVPHKILDCSQFPSHPECLNKEINVLNDDCFPGSTDQKCISETPLSKDQQDGTVTFLGCILNPENIECQKILLQKEKCGPDSQNPDCVGIHNTGKCYPGSEEPNCQRILHDCVHNPLHPKCKQQNKLEECTSQSQDPQCRQTRYFLEKCSENSDDPRCHSGKEEKPGLETDKGKCSVHSTDPECITEHTVDRECDSEDPLCKNVKQVFPLDRINPLEKISSFQCLNNPNDVRCQVEFLATPDCNVELNNPLCWPTQPTVSECSEDSTNPECGQGILPIKCDPNSKDSNCGEVPLTSHLKNSEDVVLYDDCIDGSLSPECKKKINAIECNPQSKDPQCHEARKNGLSLEECGHDSTDPKCLIDDRPKIVHVTPSNNQNPIHCTEFSTDPNCFPESVGIDIKETHCLPDSRDPNCLKDCEPNSTDPLCHKKPQPLEKLEQSIDCTKDTLHPLCQFGKKKKKNPNQCDENSSNPECVKSSQKVLDCYPGSINPECLGERELTLPCFPGSKNPACKQDEVSSVACFPGSEDPNCINDNGALKKCTQGDPDCIAVPDISKGCYPGSNEPGCIKDVQIPVTCKEGSSDPDCIGNIDITAICYPGSQDPRCEFGKKLRFKNDPKDLKCSEDSPDPKCLKQRSRPTSAEATQSHESMFKNGCFPGSDDPKCKVLDISECKPGIDDSRCKKTKPQRPAFQRKTEKPQRKNNKIRKPQTRPTSKQTMMFKGDGDFHSDKDPRYHAFHSWLYKPPPKPRPRGKRSLKGERTVLLNFNDKNLAVVLPKREHDTPNTAGESSFHVDHEALLPYPTDYIPRGPDHEATPQQKTKEITTIFLYSYLCWLTFFAACCFFLAMLIIYLLLRGNKFYDSFNV